MEVHLPQEQANIYSDEGDIVHCGGGILCLHTKVGGNRKIKLPNGKTIETELPPRSTTLFDVETGATQLA